MNASNFYLWAKDRSRGSVLQNALTFIAQLPDGKSWCVSVERASKERTGKQNRSIFGPAYKALMEFSGLEGDQDKRDLHSFMCGEFFGWVDHAFGRKPMRTTTKNEQGQRDVINTETALRFYAFLQRRGAEVGCWVPEPDPLWRERAA